MNRRVFIVLLTIFATGCAGFSKGCSQSMAGGFGANWVVVQYTVEGKPFHCWKLQGVSLSSEEGGGVNWKDSTNGHLVHITGWENRVQVIRNDYDTAGKLLGIDASLCDNGVYPKPQPVIPGR